MPALQPDQQALGQAQMVLALEKEGLRDGVMTL